MYADDVAPGIAVQVAGIASPPDSVEPVSGEVQRSHCRLVVPAPVHVPVLPVTDVGAVIVDGTVGGAVLRGASE